MALNVWSPCFHLLSVRARITDMVVQVIELRLDENSITWTNSSARIGKSIKTLVCCFCLGLAGLKGNQNCGTGLLPMGSQKVVKIAVTVEQFCDYIKTSICAYSVGECTVFKWVKEAFCSPSVLLFPPFPLPPVFTLFLVLGLNLESGAC